MSCCELTILIPCLNESKTLGHCIEKAKKFLADHRVNGEVLIADNGSTDGSQTIAEKHRANLITVPTRGYGAALKAGIDAAQGEFIIMGDADNSYDFLDLMPFLIQLRQGHDLVMGNRFQGGINKGAMPFLNRYIGNPILSWIGRIFFKSPVGDFHCGLRGFRKNVFQRLGLQGYGMEFASEMIIKASLKKLKITEVPTQLYPDGRNRRSHLRPWRDGWRHLRLLLLFSPRWLFLYPGLFLMLIGFTLILLLMNNPIAIGPINLDIHTMLFSGMFMITGLQVVTFAIYGEFIQQSKLKLKSNSSFSILKYFTLERGLFIGFLLALIGMIGSGYICFYWAYHDFGTLVPTQIMRILIPSIAFLIMGMQLIFNSFFMSFLSMNFE